MHLQGLRKVEARKAGGWVDWGGMQGRYKVKV
jgi:hypothetical protein